MTPTRIQAEWNEATRGDHSVLADWGIEVICLQQDRVTEKAGATVDNCRDSSGVGLGMVVSYTAGGFVHPTAGDRRHCRRVPVHWRPRITLTALRWTCAVGPRREDVAKFYLIARMEVWP